MFTGLVEETGIVEYVRKKRGSVVFTIRGKKTIKNLDIDHSISVEGVCLTVIKRGKDTFDVQAVEETLKKTIPGGKLYGKRIAISVSVSEDLEQLGLSQQHLQDISIEIARYLIVNGAKLMYGGDLRHGGFTELFSELSYQYRFLHDREKKFVNYCPFPNARLLTVKDKAMILQKQVELRILDIPEQFVKAEPEKEIVIAEKEELNSVPTENLLCTSGINEYYKLVFADNGIGIAEGVDFRNSESLGLQLVNALVDQLDGRFELKRDRGTQFEIWFKDLRK
jgi:two-component sensor histidine kinase